jgi:hypothetical protein
MFGVLTVSLPIFAVIALGWFAARARLAPPVMMEAIGAFSFGFALPALMLRLMAGQPLAESVDPRFFAAYLGSCLLVLLLGMGAAAALGRPRPHAAGIGVACGFGNVGYLGPPLLIALLGAERSSGPLATAILGEVVVMLLLGEVLMARRGVGSPLGRALRIVSTSPVILAILLGAALGSTEAALPPALDGTLAFLGSAAGPTALFSLGGALGRLRFRRRLLATVTAISMVKLGLYPGLTWAALGPVGFGLDPAQVAAGVLLAAMPIANNAFILAQRHGAAVEEVSAAVLISTILAVGAWPFTAWLVAPPT